MALFFISANLASILHRSCHKHQFCIDSTSIISVNSVSFSVIFASFPVIFVSFSIKFSANLYQLTYIMSLCRYLATGMDLFSLGEPCVRCAMALAHSRLARCFFAISDPQGGGLGGVAFVNSDARLNHRYAAFRVAVAVDDSGSGDSGSG
jgi:hypothetical protein